MSKKRITIFNTPIDALTLEETVNEIDNAIVSGSQLHHIAVNVAKVVHMQTDKDLYESVVSADLINADGQPLVWVSRLFGKPLPERVAGVDLMQRAVELAAKKGYKIFLFGAKEEVVRKVVAIFERQYSPSLISGFRNGYFSKDEEPEIARQISDSGANMLFVAITSPKKEHFLYENKELLKRVNFVMGVGGTFDVIAGQVKRAPQWMQRAGLEWLYRVGQEPGRMWKRYLITNSLFFYYIVRELFAPNKLSHNRKMTK